MASVEDKLKIVEEKFRKGSKSYSAARYIVRQNREIPKEEQQAIVGELDVSPKSLEYVFGKLKKLGLYGPQDITLPFDTYEPPKVYDEPDRPIQEIPQDESYIQHESPNIPKQPIYVTVEDLQRLEGKFTESIKYLAAVINGEEPLEEDELLEDTIAEINPPEEMSITDPSLTRKSVWLKPKTIMYFDLTRQGIFSMYAGSNEPSPLTQFRGNLSDFFNTIADDYFVRNFNADIGLLMRRYVR